MLIWCLLKPFALITPTYFFYYLAFQNLLIMSVPQEDYSRNALNLISTFYQIYFQMYISFSTHGQQLIMSLPPVVCRRAHVLFTLFVFVCAQWCPTHIASCFCFVFLRLVCPMLPVSLDYPSFLIVPSVFSNIYFRTNYYCE